MEGAKRSYGFDFLRAAACIAIIYLHTFFSTTLAFPEAMGPARTLVYDMLIHNLMWCVPCFIMVTGALLLPPEKEIGYRTLFGKYVLRIVKAIVVFGVLIVVLEMIFNPDRRTGAYFLQGLYKVWTGDTWSHMWYLYCLIGLYLLLPFYKMVTARAQERDIRYLLIVYAAFLALLPLLEAFGIRCGFYIHVSTIYPFWLFFGYYLHRWGGRVRRGVYAALAAGATALIVLTTWVRIRFDIAGLDQLFEYNSLLVIVQAAGVAGLFFGSRSDGSSVGARILRHIDAHSFGIYLIHMAFVRLIYKHLHFDPFMFGAPDSAAGVISGILGVTVVVAASFAASYAVTWIFKKIPFLRSIV